jgi:1-aminocyclopropane-1-carboxylate deaminase/D-cysteine desulfhydrase-like pyridoxal-dependent ACC family enzyme
MTRPDYFTGTGWLERHYDPNTYAAMTLHVQMEKRPTVVLDRIVVADGQTASHAEMLAKLEEMARYAERF